MNISTEILGWIGNIFFVIGCLSIARRKTIRGLILNSLGNLLYLAQAIIMFNISLVMLSVFLGIINGYGIWNWKKNDK